MTSTPGDELHTPLTLGELAEAHVARHGDYPFIWFDEVWHTSGGLLRRSQQIAAGLVDGGIAPGDRVVVTMPNSPDVPVLYSAIWRAGAVVTPAMFLMSAAELRHVIEDSGARLVITDPELLGKVVEAVQGVEPTPAIIVTEQTSGHASVADLEVDRLGEVIPRDPGDLAALLYTGGTTGRAKGVMLSHTNLIHAAESGSALDTELGLERELLTLPLSHAFGLLATIGALTCQLRRTWVMPRRFVPSTVLALLDRHGVGLMQAVPSMLQMILAEPLEDYDLTSLRAIYSGGASLAPDVLVEFQRRVPSATIIEGYGLTESATLATANPLAAPRTGSVGQPLPGVEIRIVDSDGRDQPPGEPGEVLTKSPSVMLGYWRDEEATASVLSDGWLATGDVGYLDDDGYLFILDRKKDLIIRGGFNVFPRDIEDALMEHPAVQMVAVVGRPDPTLGEEIVAFVMLGDDAVSADELLEWSRHRLGAYKWPRELHVVSEIPLTDVGKVDRKALRQTSDGARR